MSSRGALSDSSGPRRFLACGAKSSAASMGTMISPLGTKRCSGTSRKPRKCGCRVSKRVATGNSCRPRYPRALGYREGAILPEAERVGGATSTSSSTRLRPRTGRDDRRRWGIAERTPTNDDQQSWREALKATKTDAETVVTREAKAPRPSHRPAEHRFGDRSEFRCHRG
jgi:hypothetical protein